MGTLVCEEKQQSEAEPNSEQLLSHSSAGTEIQDEEGSRHVDSGSTKEEEEPKPKKRRLKTRSDSNSDDDSVTSETLCENETDAPQLYDCKEEEVLTVQQLCNQEWNSNLDQEEQDAAQVKEEEGKLCSSQEEEDFGLKQETDAFMVTPADEDNDKSETEANSEQLLSHNSADTESKDQGADKRLFSTGPSRRFLGLVVLSEEEKRAVLVQCHNDPGTGNPTGIRTTTDRLNDSIFRLLKIKPAVSSAYHPQTNGQVLCSIEKAQTRQQKTFGD
ncbi:uncharacterized protein KZ484_012062 [Pholidichthys leucotaenia]